MKFSRYVNGKPTRQPTSPPIAIRNAVTLTSHLGRALQTATRITAATIIGIAAKTVTSTTSRDVPKRAATIQSVPATETSEVDLAASIASKEMAAMTGVKSAGRRK